jgi:hypothetical protein
MPAAGVSWERGVDVVEVVGEGARMLGKFIRQMGEKMLGG